MPSHNERRLAHRFATEYNSCSATTKIVAVQAGIRQESPDAVCRLDDGRIIGLELTSIMPPKGTPARHKPHINRDLSALPRTLQRKLLNNYLGEGMDEVWLAVDLRLTVSQKDVESVVRQIQVPPRFSEVFLRWPLPGKSDQVSIGMFELTNRMFLRPNLPRPQH